MKRIIPGDLVEYRPSKKDDPHENWKVEPSIFKVIFINGNYTWVDYLPNNPGPWTGGLILKTKELFKIKCKKTV